MKINEQQQNGATEQSGTGESPAALHPRGHEAGFASASETVAHFGETGGWTESADQKS